MPNLCFELCFFEGNGRFLRGAQYFFYYQYFFDFQELAIGESPQADYPARWSHCKQISAVGFSRRLLGVFRMALADFKEFMMGFNHVEIHFSNMILLCVHRII